ncbi:patatin-like phospholipase family protein [Roseovarius aquimarinus]|uniref:Patatin-like phospholipase family protein n=1 Tax=Roseovarius aquimarinus TaxID=1229156 RepID=A0ABW7I6V1_9RHOB
MGPRPPYDQIVFSGGGTRCFWQGGFLDVVRDPLGLDPARISAVSGGALTGAGFITRQGARILSLMKEAFAEQQSNAPMHEIAEGAGISPHQRIYREVVEAAMTRKAIETIANGPVFQIYLGHPPTGTLAPMTGVAATLAYEAELHLISSPHFNWAERIGVTATMVDARQAARDGRLTDLICAAAVIPPLFDLARWDGKDVIDGGMSDQAPMPEPDEGRSLILLTRAYRRIPEIEGRHYVAPGDEVEADKVDFTDPAKIDRTWNQGKNEGERFLRGAEK